MAKLSQKGSDCKVSSRVRFMLQDVIELRANKWVPRRDENAPKTIDQIQKEAERDAIESANFLANATPRKHDNRDDRRRVQSKLTVYFFSFYYNGLLDNMGKKTLGSVFFQILWIKGIMGRG